MEKPPIKIFYRKLGKEQALGLAFKDTRVIHIDSRLQGLEKLTVLIHEIMHVQQPKWAEIKVEGNAKELAQLLWENKIRILE
jgi:hypothetical protein